MKKQDKDILEKLWNYPIFIFGDTPRNVILNHLLGVGTEKEVNENFSNGCPRIDELSISLKMSGQKLRYHLNLLVKEGIVRKKTYKNIRFFDEFYINEKNPLGKFLLKMDDVSEKFAEKYEDVVEEKDEQQ